MPLREALEKALRIYEKERRHAAPTDVIAQNLGYKSANNGAALAAIASLRSYGLLEKAQEGKLAISKSVETYKFAPDEELRHDLQIQWLRAPVVFASMLDAYGSGLPSDATIRYHLIEQGFNPPAAESVLNVFKESVDFAKYFDAKSKADNADQNIEPAELHASPLPAASELPIKSVNEPAGQSSTITHDRIPVRLSGGRRAWLEIPSPFFNADKKRLKAQIDLLLAEDDAENSVDGE